MLHVNFNPSFSVGYASSEEMEIELFENIVNISMQAPDGTAVTGNITLQELMELCVRAQDYMNKRNSK